MSLQRTNIWSVFTKIRDGNELKFCLEELPNEKFSEMLEFFYDQFTPEEAIHKAAGITQNEVAFNEYKRYVQRLLEDGTGHMDACYLVQESGEKTIVGGSILLLKGNGDPPVDWDKLIEEAQTQEMKKFLRAIQFMRGACNIKKKLNLDSYYHDAGISVHRDYRKLGIAGELFKARVQVCRQYGVPMTDAWMSSYGTAKAAAKLGWETIHELKFSDISKAADVTFEGVPPTCKLMAIRTDD